MTGSDHATALDFDIEGADVDDFAAAHLRGEALAALQRAARAHGHTLEISLTLPVLPSGLTADGLTVLRTTLAAGVRVSLVNGMAMDYGDSAAPDPAGRMGTYAIDVARGVTRQIARFFPRVHGAALHRMVEVTPMIGVNDVNDEVFTLADATSLATWARADDLGSLGMWEAGRDRACPTPEKFAQDNCSSVAETPWAFSRALGAAGS